MKKKVAAYATVALLASNSFAASASAMSYTVQKGDTLYKIAQKNQTSVDALKKLNNLSSDIIYVNQTLEVTPKVPAANSSAKPTAAKPANTYTVVSGDTLIQIANRHQISLAELMSWNNIKGHIIHPGQKLVVSKGGSQQDAGQPTAPAPAPAPVPAPAAKPKPASGTTTYTVKAGDTLSKIGLQYSVTVQELKALNNLKSDLIYVGQTLKVSGSSKPVSKPAKPSAPASSSVVDQAYSLLGVPYEWAGNTPSGFDCSGFIYYAYNQSGKQIGRYSSDGYFNRSYYIDQPKPGDLVFFANTYKPGISHMGIYVGNNEFIHASSSGGVMKSNLDNSYYKSHFDSFKRFY
ncbi:peptidoglycan endopeptidase [Bacillus sp. REN3]|uniref:C40 family peptidase n=1 Tax=Bacillus sp. REN3 TaxID=2802440 RepID=UPI001AEE6805|nr:peptidoglycan endopeptidase [Bacillus sp. REN3]